MDRRLPLTILMLMLLLSLLLPSAFAGELSPSDAKALREDVRAMMAAYARGAPIPASSGWPAVMTPSRRSPVMR